MTIMVKAKHTNELVKVTVDEGVIRMAIAFVDIFHNNIAVQ